MGKYIDSEKLITIIEERKAQQDQWINRYHDPINQGISQELTEIRSIITSLQQEPRFPQYNNIVEKVFGAGNLEGWERDEAEMLVALAKEELLKSLQQEQQEQPEVDLEKEFAHEYAIYHLPTFIIASIVDGTELIDFIYKTAHHFWNKGFNARNY